jgi:hypothetical protein
MARYPSARLRQRSRPSSQWCDTATLTCTTSLRSIGQRRWQLSNVHSYSGPVLQVRREVVALVDANPGILRLSHFDDGVMCHLQRRPEPLVAAALREIGRRTDLPGATNKSAYLTHWLMRFADDPSIPSLAGVQSQLSPRDDTSHCESPDSCVTPVVTGSLQTMQLA